MTSKREPTALVDKSWNRNFEVVRGEGSSEINPAHVAIAEFLQIAQKPQIQIM